MAMELQLGLALIPTNPIKPFDLNTHNNNPISLVFDSINHKKRSRHLDSSPTFPRTTLPLLLWNDHPNDGDGDDSNDPLSASSNDSDEEEEKRENGLVGWPPLKKRRKSLFMKEGVGRTAVIRRPAVKNDGGFWRGLDLNNSRYVKVKMEGVGIARKVDLREHHSFDALRATLMNMFDETNSEGYRLTFQNTNGEWLLAENVIWRNFIGDVQRIKLEKKSG